MIRVAAIDTSTWWGSLALLEAPSGEVPAVLVAEAGILVRDSHSAHLLPLLERLIEQAGWSRAGLDLYAAARGPGSFTGIRIGLGTVQGLGLASDRPVLGVGTLPALADAHGPDDRERLPMLDAGRGETYMARYDARSFPPEVIVPPWVGPPESACSPGADRPAVFGPGTRPYRQRLQAAGALVRRTPTGVAAAVGRIAWSRFSSGSESGDGLSPLYIRPPDAVLKQPGRDR